MVAVVWLLYAVWRSRHRSDLATYGAFAVAVVPLLAGWIAWAWRARTRPATSAAAGGELDRAADLLAVAVRTQWERAAGERGLAAEPIPGSWSRPSLALAGPVTAAAASRRFAALPGLAPATEAQLATGQIDDLHAVYGGLRSGRPNARWFPPLPPLRAARAIKPAARTRQPCPQAPGWGYQSRRAGAAYFDKLASSSIQSVIPAPRPG